ncbi:hypothetical protein O6H91_16G027100 [Diphasiastrum complanatum]|uniref:Uncharacterized protein n=1 Tax=Diphasiastrum complanatum TaxID=34168 RepID=A0ACC2BAY6_DIPCM|nr:hypothetical protein O6H91_16G027100 [Diphasiastrum complanatum]
MTNNIPHQHFPLDKCDSNESARLRVLSSFYTSDCNDSDGYMMSSPIIINNPCTKDVHLQNASTCDLLDDEKYILIRERTFRRGKQVGVIKNEHERQQFPLIAILITTLRRSLLACRRSEEKASLDVGWPTNVRHVTHVTFDRFNGFLGLPMEFELEIPRRVPSASASVFGVSPESMQCSFDLKGNSVPTILLHMQERLYSQGGLQSEGIFRIDAENSHEEHVRGELNKGIIPDDIDLHCLAGLIKIQKNPLICMKVLSNKQLVETKEDHRCEHDTITWN